MGAWTGKACQRCNGKKGKKQLHLKYCYRCGITVRREKSRGAHARAIEERYGITGAQYDALYEYQSGKCYICQRATGKTRRLSVDHDHVTGEVRGLLCRPCNDILGHLRDDVLALERAVRYLQFPPFKRMMSG